MYSYFFVSHLRQESYVFGNVKNFANLKELYFGSVKRLMDGIVEVYFPLYNS